MPLRNTSAHSIFSARLLLKICSVQIKFIGRRKPLRDFLLIQEKQFDWVWVQSKREGGGILQVELSCTGVEFFVEGLRQSSFASVAPQNMDVRVVVAGYLPVVVAVLLTVSQLYSQSKRYCSVLVVQQGGSQYIPHKAEPSARPEPDSTFWTVSTSANKPKRVSNTDTKEYVLIKIFIFERAFANMASKIILKDQHDQRYSN